MDHPTSDYWPRTDTRGTKSLRLFSVPGRSARSSDYRIAATNYSVCRARPNRRMLKSNVYFATAPRNLVALLCAGICLSVLYFSFYQILYGFTLGSVTQVPTNEVHFHKVRIGIIHIINWMWLNVSYTFSMAVRKDLPQQQFRLQTFSHSVHLNKGRCKGCTYLIPDRYLHHANVII